MPNIFLNLQLFGDGEVADTGEVANPTAESIAEGGVATTEASEQVATAQDEESWDSLIKGKYKDDYEKSVKAVIDRRFRNQKDLQSQIDSIDPMIKALAQRYDVQTGVDGGIPIDVLIQKVLDDNSMYEQEAFQRGMSVEDLKQIKSLERENAQLKMNQQRSKEQEDWDALMHEANSVKEIYPQFDFDAEMSNPDFGRLLATMQRSGFPNAVRTAYEACHREEIMGNAMQYAVKQTETKISNSIQSGMRRPSENGMSSQSAGAPTSIDPSKLTKEQINDLKMRAMRGERITF